METDNAQVEASVALDKTLIRLEKYARERLLDDVARSALQPGDLTSDNSLSTFRSDIVRLPRGMYLWGGVGTGKSMLMDLAYEHIRGIRVDNVSVPSVQLYLERLAPPLPDNKVGLTEEATVGHSARAAYLRASEQTIDAAIKARGAHAPASIPCRRVHFHAFMLDVHARIHEWKQQSLATHGRSRHIDKRPERDAIVQVAKAIAQEAWLLCFDEFQVTDVADALIMSRLFGTLFAEGCVLVATSNRAPSELYADGLNREYFLPFLRQLDAHVKVHRLDAAHDYRCRGAEVTGVAGEGGEHEQTLFVPAGAEATHALEHALAVRAEASGSASHAVPSLSAAPLVSVPVMMGRALEVRSPAPGFAVASFQDLCCRPLGAADYQALCRHFHTVALTDVPLQRRSRHNEARRLITLVDELYEHRATLLMTADAAPAQLFQPLLEGTPDDNGDSEAAGRLGPRPAPVRILGGALESVTEQPVPALQAHVRRAVQQQLGAREGTSRLASPAENEDGESPATMPTTVARLELATDVDPASSAGVVAAAEDAALGELAFATRRAISRLTEMSSPRYATSPATVAVRRRVDAAKQGVS